jgi:hypothetical protein
MAAFTEQETEQQWDYELLRDGAVSGFVGEAQLESVLEQLRTLGYGIAETHGGGGHVMLLGNLFEQVSPRYCGLSVQNLGGYTPWRRHPTANRPPSAGA